MQRALWEQVTPNLRAVSVDLEGGQSVAARFLYDGPIGEVERECTLLAEAYCIADMPPDVRVTFRAVERAARNLLPGEEWVYMRREAND